MKRDIVPLFAARNAKYDTTCIPHHVTLGSTAITAEVLMPDQPAKPGAQGQPPPGP